MNPQNTLILWQMALLLHLALTLIAAIIIIRNDKPVFQTLLLICLIFILPFLGPLAFYWKRRNIKSSQ
jgi:RsiW-degrading membrane proteinase PrsW (M82 family)